MRALSNPPPLRGLCTIGLAVFDKRPAQPLRIALHFFAGRQGYGTPQARKGKKNMPLIAMNREMGSFGKDVAQGLSEALGLKVQHHEIIDHLANRARVRKSHVISFLEGTQGLVERLTVDNLKLRILTADEIVSAAEANEGIILRGWGATSLLKEIPHAVRVCVSASRRERVRRMMKRLEIEDEGSAGRIVDQNDEAAQAVEGPALPHDLRGHHQDDVGLHTHPMSAPQRIGKIFPIGQAA